MARKPADRYAVEVKQDYRREVWTAMLGQYSREEIFDLNIAFLSGPEGSEISVLLDMGADPKKLHAIDEVAANVATTTKKNNVKVNTYGCSLSKAAQRIIKKGIRIDAVNLDFCGNVSTKLLSEVEGFLPAMNDSAHICVTYLKGREARETSTLVRAVGGRKRALELVVSGYDDDGDVNCRTVELVGEGEYQNHRSPMAWHAWWYSNMSLDKFVDKLNAMVRSIFPVSHWDRLTKEDKKRAEEFAANRIDPVLRSYGCLPSKVEPDELDLEGVPRHMRFECLRKIRST